MNNNKKERISWYFYDFANSVFSTTVITVFLGPYITQIAENRAVNGNIKFIFWNISPGSLYPLIVSISVLLQVIILPVIASIADNTNYKKIFLFSSAYIGAIATCGLYFLEGTNYALGALLFIIANINFGISCALYNSYLSYISEQNLTPHKLKTKLINNTFSKLNDSNVNSISSIGWAFGYIGGGVMLVINLILYNNSNFFKISEEFATRICLASAGVWWGIFTLLPLKYLDANNVKYHIRKKNTNSINDIVLVLKSGIKELIKTTKETKQYPQTILFLVAYMLYNDGVQSVISLAALFGSAELRLSMNVLITAILIVQFVAFFGSLLLKHIATKVTTLKMLQYTIFIWIATIFYAYLFMYSEIEFYVVCTIIGVILGGTQALSRSIYSQLIPIGKEAEYFSIYELSEKGTSWLGPFIFALVYNITDSYRLAILSLVLFFLAGLILLIKFQADLNKIDNKSCNNQINQW